MRLFEFEAKGILERYGIRIPVGRFARSPFEAAAIAAGLGVPVVLKAQILASGRGKAGGILFAAGPEEARDVAARLLGSRIKGHAVTGLLVEERLDIVRQTYLSAGVDAAARSYVVLTHASGGVDIEASAFANPGTLVRQPFTPATPIGVEEAAAVAGRLGFAGEAAARLAGVIMALAEIVLERDAELVEVNPLATLPSGDLVAADARVVLDDNALFRQPGFQGRSSERADDTPLEAEARRDNLAYVDLDGDVGIIGNGAGLVMATLDLVAHFGGKPANFLDIGGGARPEVVKRALHLVMSKPGVKAVLVNILGGITRCDLVAQGVVEALAEGLVKGLAGPGGETRVAVRMIGTNEEEGARILRQAGVHVFSSMEEAVRKVLEE